MKNVQCRRHNSPPREKSLLCYKKRGKCVWVGEMRFEWLKMWRWRLSSSWVPVFYDPPFIHPWVSHVFSRFLFSFFLHLITTQRTHVIHSLSSSSLLQQTWKNKEEKASDEKLKACAEEKNIMYCDKYCIIYDTVIITIRTT